MQTINITEEQRKKLCEELGRLVFEYRKNDDIECIYFAPYINLGEIEGNVIQVTIVGKRSIEETLKQDIGEYNSKHQGQETVTNFGVKIHLETDWDEKYTMIALNPSERLRCKYLFNSVILFDKNGKYTKLKEASAKDSVEDSEIKPFLNLAEFVPPLNCELDNVLDGERIERESETIKGSTQSKLSHQFRSV